MLVNERGLSNTRRNRRWLAFVRLFSSNGCAISQEQAEQLAWDAVKLWESTP